MTADELIQPENTAPAPIDFWEGISNLFQPTEKVGELAKEGMNVGGEILGEVTKLWAEALQSFGEVMTEPGILFQPTKAVSTLTGLTGNITKAWTEVVKDLATDTIGIATGTVGDVMNIGKDIANIRTEPNPQCAQLFQPNRPIAELWSIGTKVIKSGVALASGGVETGVNITKKLLGTGTNIIKKGLGIFGKKKGETESS